MGWNPGSGLHRTVVRSHLSLRRDQRGWGAFGWTVFSSLLDMLDHQEGCGVKDSDSSFFECLKVLGVVLHAELDSWGRSSGCPEM